MLSDHMRTIDSTSVDSTSGRTLLLIAAGLVIICQLVAMALVAEGQVKKAEIRDSQLNLQRVALARCFEASSRSDRQSCLQQAGNDVAHAEPMTTLVSSSESQADDAPANPLDRAQSTRVFGFVPQTWRGFVPVAFN